MPAHTPAVSCCTKRSNFWVAIDTEFTSLEFMENADPGALPSLLSLGLVTQDGREFYGELAVGDSLRALCSNFVKTTVLSQFGKVPGEHLRAFDLACKATDFLVGLPDEVDVVHDHSIDWKLLVRLLDLADPLTRARLSRKNVWQMLGVAQTLVKKEKSSSFLCSAEEGIFAHHALADARALQCAFSACTKMS